MATEQIHMGADGEFVLSCGCPACTGVGRIDIDGDTVVYVNPAEASVDGQAGSIRNKDVFTIEEAAYYLNRGDGPKTDSTGTYNSGANWAGAQGTAGNEWYYIATSKTNGGEAHDASTAARLGLAPTGPTGPLTTINYGFYETQATLPDPYVYTVKSDGTDKQYFGMAQTAGFSTFSAAQREATRQAMESWDDLVAISFVQTHFSQGDINFMNTTTGPIQASAYLPYGASTSSVIIQDDGSRVTLYERVGDVYVNPNQASNHLFDEGQYGLTTLIHEVGHALGLQHPGNYNFSANFTATYVNGAEYYQDSNQYSIMSYWDALETGAQHVDWTNLTYRYASTPSVHDVAAIQRIYGADMTTRTGDTVYGFNSNAGNEAFDFVKTPTPVVTIWDAGGNDTLDLSGFKTPSVIDLNPGAFSSAGGTVEFLTLEQINANRALEGLAPRSQATLDQYNSLFKNPANLETGLMKDNIAIAYGATIENAVGGSGNDLIIANSVANRLDGGAGFDTVSYRASTSGVKVNLQGSADEGFARGDKLISIEGLEGSNHADVLGGSDANDTLRGLGGNDLIESGNGDDTVDGGAGNDTLKTDNGNDALFGGDGIDFLEAGNGNDILEAGAGDDRLLGGNGDDSLNGGAGADYLEGGNGADVFIFADADGATDRVTDFQRGDRVDLTGFEDANITYGKGKIFVDDGRDGDIDLTILTSGSAVPVTDIMFA